MVDWNSHSPLSRTVAMISRTVSAMEGARLAALSEMRAGRLNPVRVFQLT